VLNHRLVVISSNTINLHDQLYTKDIPDLKRILPFPFRAALLKGRGNYICLRRLAQFRRSRSLTPEQVRVLAKVLAWLPQTETGDRAELLLINSDFPVWSTLQSTPETCLGERCPFRQSGECFLYNARRRAEQAHIVIINHALLLTDLVLDNRILPEFKYLIVDEAHHLEEQATSQFGSEVSRQGIYSYLNALSHQTGGTPSGLMAEIPRIFESGISEAVQRAISRLISDVNTHVDGAERRLYELFQVLPSFLQEHAELRPGGSKGLYNQQIRLTSSYRIQPGWTELEIAAENLTTSLAQVINDLDRMVARIEAANTDESSEREELVQEIKSFVMTGNNLWSALNGILLDPSDDAIYWISITRRTQEITLHRAPLHVGPMLEERLFGENDAVVLTSATLRTGDSFRYIRERLSLEDPLESALDSPFDFKSSLLLYVPKDIPEPNQPHYQKTVERAVIDLCKATEGRALILFTSNSQLNTTYRAIQRELGEDGIVLFGQGIDGSRRQILNSFRSTPRSVLLGTRSFWEGVDVVGPALSCLVIARLPFAVPTDPVIAARAETFQDAFNEYYLPDAILRFRQGFGRLIRSQEDFGIVAVLDKRILTKPYGKTILRSLPRCTARQGPLASLPGIAERWLDPENRP